MSDTAANIHEAIQAALETVLENTFNTVVDETAQAPFIAYKTTTEPYPLKHGGYNIGRLSVVVVAETHEEVLGYTAQVVAALEGMEAASYTGLRVIGVTPGETSPDFNEDDKLWTAETPFTLEYE